MNAKLQVSDLLKRHILGDVWADRSAAADHVYYLEDKSGNMVEFDGPISRSQASKRAKSPKAEKVVDDGGNTTIAPLSMEQRNLTSASKSWFSKLPASDKKKLDAVLSKGKKAQGMRIGPGGLEETSKIHMQPNTIYYMGASSSPDMVIVTSVNDRVIKFRKYPFKSDQSIERWIGEDLIASGSKRWLSSGYVKYNPEVARSLKSMLSGGRGKTVKPKDYEPLEITVQLAATVKDPYGFVKSWGVLTGTPENIDDPAGDWTVQADGVRLKEMKRDSNITKIVKTKPA